MKGSVSKSCGCRDEAGKRLGAKCPKLRSSRHGSWGFVVDLPAGADGKRRQQRRGGFPTQDAAQTALDDLRSRLGEGGTVNDRQTTGEWLEAWLASKRALRASTRRSYRQHLDLYLIPHLGHVPLERLRAEHVAAMFNAIEATNVDRERPVGKATVQRIRATLRAALSAAVRQQRIRVNPAAFVELPSGDRPRPLVWTVERVAQWQRERDRLATEAKETGAPLRVPVRPSPVMVWTPQQTGQFLDGAADDRLYALYHLIAFRGLRRGEAVGAAWTDLDLDAGLLHVRSQIVQLGWATETGAPKSDAGERVVPLDDETVIVLRAHRARQLEERMAWGPAWTDSGLVFTKEDGSPLHPAYVTSHFEHLASKAGLPPIRLHDLRHGAASLTYLATKDLKAVQALLGHSQFSITADTYTSLFAEAEREAAEAVARLVPRRRVSGGADDPVRA